MTICKWGVTNYFANFLFQNGMGVVYLVMQFAMVF